MVFAFKLILGFFPVLEVLLDHCLRFITPAYFKRFDADASAMRSSLNQVLLGVFTVEPCAGVLTFGMLVPGREEGNISSLYDPI